MARRSTSTAAPCSCEPLVIEQPTFVRLSTAVAGKATVRADHAMARDDDCDAVVAVGAPHGTRRAGSSNARRDLMVRNGVAERNSQELAPDALLERRASNHKWNCKFPVGANSRFRGWVL